MYDREFEVKRPAERKEDEVVTRLKAAESGLLSSRDLIEVLKGRVNDLLKETEQKTASIRRLERRVKQLEAQLDDAPIDVTPWESLMKKRDGVEDVREHTGLLEDE